VNSFGRIHGALRSRQTRGRQANGERDDRSARPSMNAHAPDRAPFHAESLSRERKFFAMRDLADACVFTPHRCPPARLKNPQSTGLDAWQDAEPRVVRKQGLRRTAASVISSTRRNRPGLPGRNIPPLRAAVS
jgi:hypothetical protein